jgi:hypothetical protein
LPLQEGTEKTSPGPKWGFFNATRVLLGAPLE